MAIDIEIGSIIDFGANKDSATALSKGWSVPEQGLVWSDGPCALISFSKAPGCEIYAIQLQATPYLAQGASSQKIMIFLNGLFSSVITCSSSGKSEMLIPASIRSVLAPSSYLDVCFVFQDAVIPDTGDDRRQLGIALHRIAFG